MAPIVCPEREGLSVDNALLGRAVVGHLPVTTLRVGSRLPTELVGRPRTLLRELVLVELGSGTKEGSMVTYQFEELTERK